MEFRFLTTKITGRVSGPLEAPGYGAGDKNVKNKEQIKGLFALAGIEVLRMWELPNNYWPDSYVDLRRENPGWLVKTPHGLIELCPRKRVFSIHWEETNIRKIVTEDDVTKSETMVHAWNIEDALKYLKALVAP